MPGGVNSPVRAFKNVDGSPVFFKSAKGPILIDEDENQYIDFIGSWGPMILGHSNPIILEAIKAQLELGTSYGAPTSLENKLASIIKSQVHSMEKLRMVNSGTEATMSCIRLARGFTGKNKIIKFTGCYHGHVDSLLVKAGSGVSTFGLPDSPGIPKELAALTYSCPYNNIEALSDVINEIGDDLAAIIVEPIAGNMGFIPGEPQFLNALRELCDKHASLLIFDEVMSGFRVGLGGAQAIYKIQPDLTALGKVIGGGLPVGAFGGKQLIMDQLAPLGPIYQAGTLSGNPIAMLAGLVTLESLEEKDFYKSLHNKCDLLMNGMLELANNYDLPLQVNYLGGMFGFTFNENGPIKNFEDITNSDINLFKQFFHGMLAENIYLAPSAFEAGFISSAHTNKEINLTLDATEKVFSLL